MTSALTRRQFVSSAMVAASLPAATGPLEIDSVRAVPLTLLPASRFGTDRFKGDRDPARSRWFGPFSQLTGATLVEIKTTQGLTGYGMGGGGRAACYIIENHLRDLLIGANALNAELLWDQMFASSSFYGRKGLAIQAISGIDLALWDLAGKAAGVPVYKLIGGAVQNKVPAYFTSAKPEAGLELGFKAFKLPMDISPEEPNARERIVERLMKARRTIGKDAELMIDVLCRWTVPFTIEMAQRLHDADVRLHFIEEPILPDDIPGYEKLCREVKGTRIASGEHEYTHFGFHELIRHKAAHILQPDLTWSGGLTTGKRVVELAARAGLPVMPHRGGSAFGMQLIVTSKQCPLAESFGTGEGNEMWSRLAAPFDKGFYRAPEGPGMGIDLPQGVLKQYGL
jgi:L-rhamnonate dehydratase